MRTLLLLGACCVFAVAPANATLVYGFDCLTNNTGQCSTLAPQLTLDLTVSGGVATFTLENAGPLDSSITAIYWHDLVGVLGAITNSNLAPSSGVSYAVGCSPSDPPAAPSGWTTERCVSATSGPGGVSAHGINPGETLSINFPVSSSLTEFDFDNFIQSGDLSVAIHVQSVGTSGLSEALVLVPGGGDVPEVPEPGTFAMLGGALLFLGVAYRGRAKQ